MIIVIVAFSLISLFLILNYVDFEKIISEGTNFQCNIITFAVTMAGFLFTGIGILISAIGNDRIKRLWDNYYLDNLQWSSVIGMLSSVIVIIIALILLLFKIDEGLQLLLLRVEIFAMIIATEFFVWSMERLVQVIQKLKKG